MRLGSALAQEARSINRVMSRVRRPQRVAIHPPRGYGPYSSDRNDTWLTVEELRTMVGLAAAG